MARFRNAGRARQARAAGSVDFWPRCPSARVAPLVVLAVSAACAAEPPLQFVEYVTAGAKPDAKLPLVIAIHGLGDRPEHFVGLFHDYPAQVRVVAPRGPTAHNRGYSWFPVKLPVRGDDAAMVDGIRGSAAKVAALTRYLARKRPTKGRPVVTGFSQGGILSFALAASEPDLFAVAIPMAGSLPPALWPKAGARTVPVQAVHGDADRVVPLAGAEATVARLSGAKLLVLPGVAHRLPRALVGAMYERVEAATR